MSAVAEMSVVAAVPQVTHWEFRRPPRKAERIKKVGDERRQKKTREKRRRASSVERCF